MEPGNSFSDYLKKLEEFDVVEQKEDFSYRIDSIIFILNEIKKLKLKHPSLQIFCKKDYTEIKVGNIKTDHHFKAKLTAPSGLSLIESSLPEFRINMADEDSNNSIFKSNTTLSSIFDAFLMVLENMQEFYKNLDTIDQLCDVVEPQTITTKTNWRLIKFQEKVFLKIEIINPLDVSSVRCNFFGRDSDVNELNKIFEEKQEDKWDCSIDIYKNLLRIFDLMFLPMKADDEIEDDLPPCNICFSYRSEELQIPLISCNNKKCDSIFHVFCLDKWFSSHKETKEILTMLIGVCPFCKEKLSASLSELLQK